MTEPMSDPHIRLDQFLKWQGLTATGGQAKVVIQGGQVRVNGEVDTRRGKKLVAGDVVEFEGQKFTVTLDESDDDDLADE